MGFLRAAEVVLSVEVGGERIPVIRETNPILGNIPFPSTNLTCFNGSAVMLFTGSESFFRALAIGNIVGGDLEPPMTQAEP